MSDNAKVQVQKTFPDASVERVRDSLFKVAGIAGCNAVGINEEEAWAAAVPYAKSFAASQQQGENLLTIQSLPPFSGKGKSPIADAQAEAEAMLAEYRHALEDGLNAECDRYELVCMHWLLGQKNVGLAYSVELQRAYLLFAGADRPQSDYEPIWLLDAAKELTMLMRTLVVPDQCSTAITYWGGIKRGIVFAYRFKLADAPTSIKF
jgi:hypothetical protein